MPVILYAPEVGAYFVDADVNYDDGRGQFVFTKIESEAKRFADAGDALEWWKTPSTVHPIRLTDGKPNRPITAFTVELKTVPA